jgi:hypothetical protein
MCKTWSRGKFVDRNLWRYDPAGTNTLFVQKAPIGNHCVHLVDAEKPKGEWNTLDLITFNGNSIHVVNGQVVMRLYNAQRTRQRRARADHLRENQFADGRRRMLLPQRGSPAHHRNPG